MKYIYGLLLLLCTNTQTSSWTQKISSSEFKEQLNPYHKTDASDKSFTKRLKSYLARPFKTGTQTTRTVYDRLKPKPVKEYQLPMAEEESSGIINTLHQGAKKLWRGTRHVGAGIGAGAAGIGTTAAGMATHYVVRPALAVGSLGASEQKSREFFSNIFRKPNKQERPKHPLPASYQQPTKTSENLNFLDDLETRGDEAAPVMKRPPNNLYNQYNMSYANN